MAVLDDLVGAVKSSGDGSKPKTAYLVVGERAKSSEQLTAWAKAYRENPGPMIRFIETEEEQSP